LSHSFGIDEIVLTSPTLRYRWLQFTDKEAADLWTTRTYFYHHKVRYNLFNGRTMFFLQKRMFGKSRAIDWEEYVDNLQTAQLDLFTVLEEQRKTGEKDNEFVREWERANKIVENYSHKRQTGELIL
jgi:hypothetical protein